MSAAPTTPWQARLAAMDHSKGTSNKMIQDAMHAEIVALRKLLKPNIVAWRAAKTEQIRGGKTEQRLQAELSVALRDLGNHRWRLKAARKSRDEWKEAALRYQKQLIERKP